MLYKCLMLLMLFTGIAEPINTEEVILWKESSKLTWSDFKARPKNIGSIVALTSSGITFRFSVKEENGTIKYFSTQIEAHFYPKHSWVHKNLASAHVLSHEQLHFDITELHARMFRKRVAHVPISNTIKKDLDQIYEDINKQMDVMQKAYDLETDHSRNKEKQAVWAHNIKMELNNYKAFKE